MRTIAQTQRLVDNFRAPYSPVHENDQHAALDYTAASRSNGCIYTRLRSSDTHPSFPSRKSAHAATSSSSWTQACVGHRSTHLHRFGPTC